jgi:hypothetical protein
VYVPPMPCDKGLWKQLLLSTDRCCNVCGRNLITGLTSATSPRVDILSTCKVRQKFGVSLHLLTCSPSARPSWLLYRRGRKSRRDLWITMYRNNIQHNVNSQQQRSYVDVTKSNTNQVADTAITLTKFLDEFKDCLINCHNKIAWYWTCLQC